MRLHQRFRTYRKFVRLYALHLGNAYLAFWWRGYLRRHPELAQHPEGQKALRLMEERPRWSDLPSPFLRDYATQRKEG